MLRTLLMSAGLCLASGAVSAAPLSIDTFIKRPQFRLMKISPTGEYLATSVPLEGEEAVTIINRKDLKITSTMKFPKGQAVGDFVWASDDRLIVTNVKKDGGMAEPKATGEIYAISADGGNGKAIFGINAGSPFSGGSSGSHIKQAEKVEADGYVIDTLKDDENYILIASHPWAGVDGAVPTVYRLNIKSGVAQKDVRGASRNATFLADHEGVVRYSVGTDTNLVTHVHYRADEDAEWKEIASFKFGEQGAQPIAFSADNRSVYQLASVGGGPVGLYKLDLATGQNELVLQDAGGSLSEILREPGTEDVIGAYFDAGKPVAKYLDEKQKFARLHKALRKAFNGDEIEITSYTKDGKEALVRAYSDRNAGDYFVVNLETKKAEYIVSAASWIDPAKMAERKPIALKARDGLELQGYLTVPPGVAAKNLPLVVQVHGGPHFIRDTWEYNPQAQLLASQGYAVLQVNFRGSGGRGVDFQMAGYRQWGRKMQDDVTDATRWAIDQGIADAKRICIAGVSYGGYAAMMGVIREPELYRCAITYAGVSDLGYLYSKAEDGGSTYVENFLNSTLGTDQSELAQYSPLQRIAEVKTPVLVIHGGMDKVVPPAHGQDLHDALEKQGKSVEWLYKPNEAHGFWEDAARKEVAERQLAFLAKHIGPGATAVVAAK